jgi:Asp-tRNA(Asn)/Glu-tRNA(Gln) amidotransferase A subunit family amidase
MGADFEVAEATIASIHAAYRARELSPAELVRAYLDRIEAYDRGGPALNSVVVINDDALARAEELDGTEPAGPLHGIPVVLKDNINTHDLPTAYGSVAMQGYRPPADATVARRLREAGAIVLAKTTLPDWATSWFSYSSLTTETRNPYDPNRDPGGSSSGTGAAVAANFTTVGLGTDCGGSVRLPASFCNLVGVRSTPGVVPRTGTSYLVIPQDTVGPMARTVEDARRVFTVIAGYDSADHYSVAATISRPPAELGDGALDGARIGLVTNAIGDDAGVRELIAAAARALEGAGARVEEVELPDLFDHIVATSMYTDRSKHDLDRFLAELPNPPIPNLRTAYENGQYDKRLDLMDAIMDGPEDPDHDPDYLARFAARHEFTLVVTNVMARFDALAYPSVQVPPPTMDGRADWTTLTLPTNTLIASQTWLPAITVPAGFTPEGAPVGLELVGRPYDEAALFRLAHGYEQATQHRRAPEACP